MGGQSDPRERNANGRTKSGLYRIFIPAYEALEGFFDVHGNPVTFDPDSPVPGIDGDSITIGSKTIPQETRETPSSLTPRNLTRLSTVPVYRR